MSQSLSYVLLHLVFSTKHRRPFLKKPEHRNVMTGYLIGTLSNIKCPSLRTGVVEDLVHILCALHRSVEISKLLEEIKKVLPLASSRKAPNCKPSNGKEGMEHFPSANPMSRS